MDLREGWGDHFHEPMMVLLQTNKYATKVFVKVLGVWIAMFLSIALHVLAVEEGPPKRQIISHYKSLQGV